MESISLKLLNAVLGDDELVSLIFLWASQGSLQILSMSNQSWLSKAYRLATDAWAVIDMSAWPFGAKELKDRGQSQTKHLNVRRLLAHRPIDMPEIMGANWYKRPAVKDTGVRDEDLVSAVKRLTPGKLKRLIACSSFLTQFGVSKALQMHGAGLNELCLSGCGSQNLLGGPELQAALDSCANLRVLELHGVHVSLFNVAHSLKELMLGPRTLIPSLTTTRELTGLQVLKVSDPALFWRHDRAEPEFYLELFKVCPGLREVHVHGATQVTNEILACLMIHNPHLVHFCGSRSRLIVDNRPVIMFPNLVGAGDAHPLDGGGLAYNAIRAFGKYFQAGRFLVSVDDDVAEQLGCGSLIYRSDPHVPIIEKF